jgi:hypothetical protein
VLEGEIATCQGKEVKLNGVNKELFVTRIYVRSGQ